jgi:hypothetical protein
MAKKVILVTPAKLVMSATGKARITDECRVIQCFKKGFQANTVFRDNG